MWTSLHQRLLDALEGEELLPRLQDTLGLGTPSLRADLDLLHAMQASPHLARALEGLRDDDPAPLLAALEARYPSRLPERVLHHLALAYLRQPERRERGLRGMLFLLHQRRPYLEEIADAIGSGAAVDRVLDELPRDLLAPEIEALEALGSQSTREAEAARTVYQRLDALFTTLVEEDGLEAMRASGLREVLDEARAEAISRTIEACEQRTGEADVDVFLEAIQPALQFARGLGHQEALTTWLVNAVVELGWTLRQRKELDGLRRVLDATSAFTEDLGERLERGEAFGHQSLYADVIVHRYNVSPASQHQILLRRALDLCPHHRNTRVCLAGSNLREAERMMGELERSWTVGFRRDAALEQLEDASALIDEAALLRPEHKNLPALTERRDQLRAKLGEGAG